MYRNGEKPAERLALIGVSKLLKEHYDARSEEQKRELRREMLEIE